MRKAITPIISIIVLLLITITLAGLGWNYISSYYEAMTAKTIKLVYGSETDNEVMIMNTGTADIEQSEIQVLTNGKESGVLRMIPAVLADKSSTRLIFVSEVGENVEVRIIAPGNTISYSTAIDTHLKDDFDINDDRLWAYDTHQTIPFDDGGNNVVKNAGTGFDYSANFCRDEYWVSDGRSVTLEFKVNETGTNAHFYIENGAGWLTPNYWRWAMIAGNNIFPQIHDDGISLPTPPPLIDPIETDTWYVVTLKADDANGFYMKVYKKSDPGINGEYTYDMVTGTGKDWRFCHAMYMGGAYLDNYIEHI